MTPPRLLTGAARLVDLPGNYYIGVSIAREPLAGVWLCLGPFLNDQESAEHFVPTVAACYRANDNTGTADHMVFAVIRLEHGEPLPTAFVVGPNDEIMLNHAGDAND